MVLFFRYQYLKGSFSLLVHEKEDKYLDGPRRDEGLALGGAPADRVDVVGGQIDPKVLRVVLAEALVAQQRLIAGDAHHRRHPIRLRDRPARRRRRRSPAHAAAFRKSKQEEFQSQRTRSSVSFFLPLFSTLSDTSPPTRSTLIDEAKGTEGL